MILMALLGALALFALMLAFSEIGRRLGVFRLARDPEGLAKGAGAAEAAFFALLGLLIAFSFSGAASRFEDRRHLIAEEANAIGTAYLRLDLLAAADQAPLRELFGRYLDVRIVVYRNAASDSTAARLAETAELQRQAWAASVRACQAPGAATSACMLLLPALNAMIDITTSRVVATQNHPPTVLFWLLGALSLIGALLVGYDTSVNKRRRWLHTLVFAAALSMTIYVIVDLEFPRHGLIRVDGADQVLIDLRREL